MHAETLAGLADKTIVFSKREVFKVVAMFEAMVFKHANVLKIFLQMKNPLKISLLITKLSISQTYIS
jgi:hypothetical protein